MMKIVSWNINGKRDIIQDLITQDEPDILFLSEIKCTVLPKFKGYKSIINSHSPPHYHGVSFYIKHTIKYEELEVNLEIDARSDNKSGIASAGRILAIRVNNINIVGVYTPNSGVRGLKHLSYRIDIWDQGLSDYLNSLEGDTLLIGDLNIAFGPLDVSNPHLMKRWAGYTEEERDSFQEKMSNWIDVYRRYEPKRRQYTWLSPNNGMRLDHIMVNSEELFNKIYTISFYIDVDKSDHIPIECLIIDSL